MPDFTPNNLLFELKYLQYTKFFNPSSGQESVTQASENKLLWKIVKQNSQGELLILTLETESGYSWNDITLFNSWKMLFVFTNGTELNIPEMIVYKRCPSK